MIDRVSADIVELSRQAPGIDEKARQQKVDEIERELLDVELAEESIIRTAEASDFPIFRRATANPLVVLADDSTMP